MWSFPLIKASLIAVKRRPRPRQTTLREKIAKLAGKNLDEVVVDTDSDGSDFENDGRQTKDDVGNCVETSRKSENPKVVKKIEHLFKPGPSHFAKEDYFDDSFDLKMTQQLLNELVSML